VTRPYVIDADAHVVEGAEFVMEALRRFPDQVGIRSDGVLGVLIEGRAYPDPEGPGAGCPADQGVSEHPGLDATTATGILANADADGIDEMVLFPSFAMCVPSIRDPQLGAAIARMYNRWVAELVSAGHGRLHAAGVVPIEHGELAVDALTEAKELGLVCAVVPPALATRNLDHPDLDRFFGAACDLGMALGVHGAPGLHMPKIGVDRFENYIQVHCVSFPFDQMTAMTSLVSGGVFDRHPALRVAFLEAGAGWLPWFVERLGEHYEARGDWIPGGWKRHPDDYVAGGNIWVTCEPDERMLPAVVDRLGAGGVMYASDYPHWDGAWPNSSGKLLSQPLESSALAAVAGDNARRFYSLPGV
jgi:predicted TIM-barrel fold metal-dependent hydrolase